MGARQVFTVKVRRRMAQRYEAGCSMSELMRDYGASHDTIRAELVRAGATIRGTGRPRGSSSGKVGAIEIGTALRMRRRGVKLKTIARLAGITPQSVCGAIRRAGE